MRTISSAILLAAIFAVPAYACDPGELCMDNVNPNIILHPATPVGPTPISPYDPSVDSSRGEHKSLITGTPERTEGVFHDEESSSGGNAPISAPVR